MKPSLNVKPRLGKIPRINPADWGIGMTVCVASICMRGKAIVCASDTLLSTDDFSGDVVLKVNELSDHWGVMWAANDLSPIVPILDRARRALVNAPNTLESVSRIISTAFQEERRKGAADLYLSHLGLGMEDFRQNTANLPEREWSELNAKISAFDLGCQFIVYGFDEEDEAHIFTIDNPGVVHYEDLAGFAAIGSGAYRALSSLFWFPMVKEMFALEALYQVCAAKFSAESARGVGDRTTFAFMFMPPGSDGEGGGGICPIMDPMMSGIRELWETFGCPRWPDNLNDKMFQMLAENKIAIDKAFSKKGNEPSTRRKSKKQARSKRSESQKSKDQR